MKKTLFALSTGALMPLSFSAAADLLREGDALTLTYKNYYYKESAKEGNDGRLWGHDRDEWVQAVIVDYDTGFIDDWLRLEYGVAGADDLYIGDGITDVTNLPGATPANGFEPDGMLGTQTAYVTTRLRAGDITLTAGAGKKARRAPMYLDSDTRILDATSVGYDLRAESEALTLYYTELDKLSLRNEDDWGRTLTNYRGDTIDHLRYYGGEYRFGNGLSVELGEAKSKDYLRERKASTTYRHPLDSGRALRLKGTYGTLDEAGGLYQRDAEILPFFNEEVDAQYHELSLGYSLPGHDLSLNYANVTDGDWNHNLVAQEVGFWDTSSQWAWSWFGLQGEDSLSLLALTDSGHYGIPGLRWNAGVWFSDDADGFNDFKRYEVSSVLGYAFSGALDGLSLRWYASYNRAQGEIDGDSRTAYPLGPAGLERKNVNRFYLTYTKTF